MTDAIMYLNNQNQKKDIADRSLQVVGKISYRTGAIDTRLDGDVLQEEEEGDDYPTGTLKSTIKNQGEGENSSQAVYHNISSSYISETLNKSPLVELHQDRPEVNLVYCTHNPEAQGMELLTKGAPLEDVRHHVRERMVEAFTTLERNVVEKRVGSYGVCSNGLSLPSSHPMHLSWEDVLSAASEAARNVHDDDKSKSTVANLSTLQLPINLLETYGLKVATRIKEHLAASSLHEEENGISTSYLPKTIQIHATRPLTCYPDRGTGSGLPFNLVDYLIPTSEDGSRMGWSHQIASMPLFYTTLLNETMAHFDATHLLEIKAEEERELTVEERETLDGCKLLQSMIHDLDANLTSVAGGSTQYRSFQAYENDLYTKVVPLIHDTFEELDEGSSDLLQRFFRAHGTAVRHSIARTTRALLKSGGDGGGAERYEIPDEVPLQEFALDFLLRQDCELAGISGRQPVIDRVVAGCSKAEHVVEAVQVADKSKII